MVKGGWDVDDETNIQQSNITNCVKNVAKEILEESKGNRYSNQEL